MIKNCWIFFAEEKKKKKKIFLEFVTLKFLLLKSHRNIFQIHKIQYLKKLINLIKKSLLCFFFQLFKFLLNKLNLLKINYQQYRY